MPSTRRTLDTLLFAFLVFVWAACFVLQLYTGLRPVVFCLRDLRGPHYRATLLREPGRELGSPGSFTYVVAPGFADRPISWVPYYSALRFAN